MAVSRLIGDPPTSTPPPGGAPSPAPGSDSLPKSIFSSGASRGLPLGTSFDGRASSAPFGGKIID